MGAWVGERVQKGEGIGARGRRAWVVVRGWVDWFTQQKLQGASSRTVGRQACMHAGRRGVEWHTHARAKCTLALMHARTHARTDERTVEATPSIQTIHIRITHAHCTHTHARNKKKRKKHTGALRGPGTCDTSSSPPPTRPTPASCAR